MKFKKRIAGIAIAAAVILSNALTAINTALIVEAEMHDSLSYKKVDEDGNGTDDYIEITACDKSVTEVTIPSTIDDLPVKSIGDWVFNGCTSLKSITIPDSVASIGNSAFMGCTSLSSIEIPDKITSIGLQAFSNCKSLTSIVIPDSVTSIGTYAFYGCTSLSSITIPDNVTSIGDNAFSSCTSLAGITIPGNVTSIENWVFNGCTGLKSVTISKSVTSIGERAFYGCKKLTEIEIPDSVTSIDTYAFYGCTSLKNIVIPDSVTSIGYGAFFNTALINNQTGIKYLGNWVVGCDDNVENAEIEDGTIGIAGGAFQNRKSLASITIPDSVKSIGNSAFQNCTSLTSITIPDSVTSIGVSAFADTALLNNQTGIKYLGNWVAGCDDSVEKAEIKDGTIGIAGGAFQNCKNLVSITIPDSVTSIGEMAFSSCTSLKSITIPDCVTSMADNAFDSGVEIMRGHTVKHTEEKPATCTEVGNIEYWYCKVCDKYYSDESCKTNIDLDDIKLSETVIKATGHKLIHIVPKDPTCTEAGNTEYWYCENCKKYFSDKACKNEIKLSETVIKTTGHKLTYTEKMDATCTEVGNTEYWYCENCKKYFSDKACENEIKLSETVIKATGHKLTHIEKKEPTCIEVGNIEYWYCENCKKYFSDENCKTEIELSDTLIPMKISGDLNDDGQASVSDIVILQQYLIKTKKLTVAQWKLADMNGDGKVNVFDFIILKRKLLK